MFGFLTSGTREIDDPLVSVKAVSAWLRGLPAQDVIGRQQLVLGALDMARQTRRTIDPARVQAILFLDAALGADRRQLVKQYVENADAGTQLPQRIWQAAFDLSQGYVAAYQVALEQALLQSNNPRWKPLIPLLFARLVHYFGTDAKLRVFRFERWIPAKWVELHHVYMRAAELGLDRVPTVLGHGPNTTQWTVEQEYVYVLLIHQLNTGNMSPAELDWAYAQIRGWSRRLSLDAVARSMEGFLVDVGGKTGLARPAGNDPGLMLRYLDTTPLCEQLDRAIAALRHAEGADRAPVLSINHRRIAILEKIRPAVAPNLNANHRRDPRNACAVTARVRVGLTRICHELAAGKASAPSQEEAAVPEQIEVYTVADVAPVKRRLREEHDSIAASLSSFTDPMWHVKDRSIAGLRIGATGGVGLALALGALVAVRQSDVSEWLLGVVRRLNKISPEEVEGGLAIIADNVVPVTLFTKRESKDDMGFVVNGVDVSTIGARFDALYLPPPSRPDKPLMVKTIIVPTPEYIEGRNVMLTTGRSVYTIAMRHLIEQRADWSWCAIQISDKKSRT
jgi:cyclic-di-GMP-binding protein